MPRVWFTRSLLLVGAVTALGGCAKDRPASPDIEPADNAAIEPTADDSPQASFPAEEAPTEEAPAEEAPAPAWKQVQTSDLSPEQNDAFRRGVSARTSLGAKLIGTLTETIEKDGPAQAVHVCRELAPQFAAEIGEQYNVEVGRSSTRLRNSKNIAPEWAAEIIAGNDSKEVLLVGPDDQVGALTPIFTGELCTRCHGPADTIDSGVLAAIQQDYPLDQATGFKSGDLRGWFWVEAPIATTPPTPDVSADDTPEEAEN